MKRMSLKTCFCENSFFTYSVSTIKEENINNEIRKTLICLSKQNLKMDQNFGTF